MKRNIIFRLICLLLIAVLLGACGSDSSSAKRPPLSTDFTQQVNSYSFAAQPSETLAFSEQSAQRVLEAVASLQPEYPYADMYELDEVKKRLDFIFPYLFAPQDVSTALSFRIQLPYF